MNRTAVFKELRDEGWLVVAFIPEALKGLTQEEKEDVQRAMTIAAYNMIDKIQEGKDV